MWALRVGLAHQWNDEDVDHLHEILIALPFSVKVRSVSTLSVRLFTIGTERRLGSIRSIQFLSSRLTEHTTIFSARRRASLSDTKADVQTRCHRLMSRG